jgi:hypothetical protein
VRFIRQLGRIPSIRKLHRPICPSPQHCNTKPQTVATHNVGLSSNHSHCFRPGHVAERAVNGRSIFESCHLHCGRVGAISDAHEFYRRQDAPAQMNTPGPAIKGRAFSGSLPQNEQLRNGDSPIETRMPP